MKKKRKEILSNIRDLIGNSAYENKLSLFITNNNLNQAAIFCIDDGELLPQAEKKQIAFKHKKHINDRAFIFSLDSNWEFNSDGELKHFTAGAIVWKQCADEKKYCLIKRRLYPIGLWTIPAGHIELQEEPTDTVIREIIEETKLTPVKVDFLYKEILPDKCRRGSNFHEWYLFLCQCEGIPVANDEGDEIMWYTPDEIRNLEYLTPPTKHFFDKYFKSVR
jgi:8-oxo-dGTP pyrophosphatase MutT (NUDIX family)